MEDLEVLGDNFMEKQDDIQHKKYNGKVLKQNDLFEILPFKKTKTQQLIKSGELPLVKIGRDYITTFKLIEEWIVNHIGEEIFYK